MGERGSSRVVRPRDLGGPIVSFEDDLPSAAAGRSVTLTLADEEIVIRGDGGRSPSPSNVTRRLRSRSRVAGRSPRHPGRAPMLKIGQRDRDRPNQPNRRQLRRRVHATAQADALSLNASAGSRARKTSRLLRSYADIATPAPFILIDAGPLRTRRRHGRRKTSTSRGTSIATRDRTPALRARIRSSFVVVWRPACRARAKYDHRTSRTQSWSRWEPDHAASTVTNLRKGHQSDLGFGAADRSEKRAPVAGGEVMADAADRMCRGFAPPGRPHPCRKTCCGGQVLEIFVRRHRSRSAASAIPRAIAKADNRQGRQTSWPRTSLTSSPRIPRSCAHDGARPTRRRDALCCMFCSWCLQRAA